MSKPQLQNFTFLAHNETERDAFLSLEAWAHCSGDAQYHVDDGDVLRFSSVTDLDNLLHDLRCRTARDRGYAGFSEYTKERMRKKLRDAQAYLASKAQLSDLQDLALNADEAFSEALQAHYGNNAGDMRYERDVHPKHVADLADKMLVCCDGYLKAVREHRKTYGI